MLFLAPDAFAQTCVTQNTTCSATAGQTVTIVPGSTISTVGIPSLNATGAGASITGSNATIIHDDVSYAVIGSNGASISLTDSSITSTYPGAGGVGPVAVFLQTGSSAVLNNVDINTNGYTTHGIKTSTSTLQMYGGSIVINSPSFNAYGVWSDPGSNITLDGVAITTLQSSSSVGIASVGTTSTVTAQNGFSVNTSGTNSYGIWALAGTALIYDGSVHTRAAFSYGLFAQNNGVIIGERMNVRSDTMAAINVAAGGSVDLEDSTLTTNGPAITAPSAGTVTLRGAATTVSSGSNQLAIYDGTATDTFTLNIVENAAVTGDMWDRGSLGVGPGGMFVNILSGGSITGVARDVRSMNVDGTGEWHVSGNSNITDTVTNAGLVQFTPPPSDSGPFKTLTATNYTGQGGTLGVNTHLGSDGSPSDMLVIDGGTASGTSLLSVANAGGAGDLTQLNGILVVDAINGGTTVPGLFGLAGPVVAGPYEYSLYRGSVDASNPNA
ncbi:pertactin-like passenger domain-containing protein, partial [Hyphomicrobium sulfonivorans]|uniref:pertactin-like passenger domain-containing protein n=1 Tax=Hyphomicrobium sulfonivorans TaxID=121290 RepID=UPI000B209545